MIRNIFIIQNGIALVKLHFGNCHSLTGDSTLIAGFMSGLDSFSQEITGSSIKSMTVEDYHFYFYKNGDPLELLYVFICDSDDDSEQIDFKLKKTAELFQDKYAGKVDDFDGEISKFKAFKETLLDMNIAQKNCGGRPECEGCPNSTNVLKFLGSFQKEKKGFFSRLKSFFKR